MGERLLIGIAGPTCSGKTSLVTELKQRFGGDMSTLSFDEYDLYTRRDLKLRAIAESGAVFNWDSPAAFDYQGYLEDLQRLRDGRPVTTASGSRESKKLGVEGITVAPARYTVVEGILIFLDDRASELFDRRFFIDIPTDEIVRKRMGRVKEFGSAPANNPTYIQTTMLEGIEYFIRPQREKVQLVLDGTKPISELADQVVAVL